MIGQLINLSVFWITLSSIFLCGMWNSNRNIHSRKKHEYCSTSWWGDWIRYQSFKIWLKLWIPRWLYKNHICIYTHAVNGEEILYQLKWRIPLIFKPIGFHNNFNWLWGFLHRSQSSLRSRMRSIKHRLDTECVMTSLSKNTGFGLVYLED